MKCEDCGVDMELEDYCGKTIWRCEICDRMEDYEK